MHSGQLVSAILHVGPLNVVHDPLPVHLSGVRRTVYFDTYLHNADIATYVDCTLVTQKPDEQQDVADHFLVGCTMCPCSLNRFAYCYWITIITTPSSAGIRSHGT